MQIQVQEQAKIETVSRTQRSVRTFRRQLQAFSCTVPALVLLAIFLLYPIGYVVYLSFQRWNLLGTPHFIGLENYATILFRDSAFFQWMFSTGANPGLFPAALANIGLKFPDWQHTNGIVAMVLVVVMNTWKSTGFSMILYLAACSLSAPNSMRRHRSMGCAMPGSASATSRGLFSYRRPRY